MQKEPVRLFRPKETPFVEQQAVNESRERGWAVDTDEPGIQLAWYMQTT
jgi:hypothetical protein